MTRIIFQYNDVPLLHILIHRSMRFQTYIPLLATPDACREVIAVLLNHYSDNVDAVMQQVPALMQHVPALIEYGVHTDFEVLLVLLNFPAARERFYRCYQETLTGNMRQLLASVWLHAHSFRPGEWRYWYHISFPPSNRQGSVVAQRCADEGSVVAQRCADEAWCPKEHTSFSDACHTTVLGTLLAARRFAVILPLEVWVAIFSHFQRRHYCSPLRLFF